jgi:hypothetical protein
MTTINIAPDNSLFESTAFHCCMLYISVLHKTTHDTCAHLNSVTVECQQLTQLEAQQQRWSRDEHLLYADLREHVDVFLRGSAMLTTGKLLCC